MAIKLPKLLHLTTVNNALYSPYGLLMKHSSMGIKSEKKTFFHGYKIKLRSCNQRYFKCRISANTLEKKLERKNVHKSNSAQS
jgi:hypothetical protein